MMIDSVCVTWTVTVVLVIGPVYAAPTTTAFLQTFLEDYDNRIPPNLDGKEPTEVAVSVKVDSIDSVSESNMEFSANILLTQQWVDRRLMFFGLIKSEYLELDTKMMTGVWVPDLYISNEKQASFHTITVPNKMMHIYKNGTVRYKARLSLTASCPMKLHKYPMDRQVCSFRMRSFAYSKNTVLLKWKREGAIALKEMELSQFKIHGTNHYNCCDSTRNCSLEKPAGEEGDFSCIRSDFILDRELGYYMIQLYIPSLLVVALSWVSFWLSVDAVPARISLGILTVLTMTTQRSSATSSLPRVSYIKAIDVWMASCLVFVIAALLEYAFTNVLMRKQKECNGKPDYHKEETANNDAKHPLCTSCGEEAMAALNPDMTRTSIHIAYSSSSDVIDKVARVLFPLSFLVFAVCYWIVYARLITDSTLVLEAVRNMTKWPPESADSNMTETDY